jgi:uncharacterized protein YtpQ (UPF0354 family)
MKRLSLFFLLLLAGIATSSCARTGLQSPEEFTRDFAAALQKARPGLQVTVVQDLELKLAREDGSSATSFLNIPYGLYRQSPQGKDEILERYLAATLETLSQEIRPVDRTRIVPVLKDRGWLEETRLALRGKDGQPAPEYVAEDFNRELVIVYAEDSPNHVRYLTPDDLEPAKVERGALKALAIENLKRLSPKIEIKGEKGRYQVTGGESYDASLLLLDSIWTGGQLVVQGDPVVAIPNRELLLVTGSQDAEGIAKLRQVAEEGSTGNPYRLTSKLFVYRGGRFEEWR